MYACLCRELANLLGDAWPAGVVVTLVGPGITGTNHKIKLTNEMAAGPDSRLECRVRQGLYHKLFSVEVGDRQPSTSTDGGSKGAKPPSTQHTRWRRRDPTRTNAKRGKGDDGAGSDDDVTPPHLAVLFNAGVHSPELVADWAPTLVLLLKAEVPVVVTAFDEGEAARAELVLTRPTSVPKQSLRSDSGQQQLDLRARLEFGPELNRWGSLLRNSHPGEPLYTLQSLFGNSRCWFGIKGRQPPGQESTPSSFTTQWLQSDMGRDWLSLVSG